MAVYETFAAHNDAYVASCDQGNLPEVGAPNKKLFVIACIDVRVDPAAQLGLGPADAHILRNAGASAREALRSIVISQRLAGTREIAVLHHSDCGLYLFTNETLKAKIKSESPGNLDVAIAADAIDFHATYSNLDESVKADVKFLKENPLVLEGTVITGWALDTATGKVRRVV